MHKRFDLPMPEMLAWDIDSIEALAAARFDDPRDRRRFFEAGDNQIAGVGDGFQRNSPPWIETVKSLHPGFPVFGSMIEVSECLTRLIGQYNAMLWLGLYPEEMARAMARIGEFYYECAKAEMEAGRDWLDGFVIWGDVAYKGGTFMSPACWREHFKPWVARIVTHAHTQGLPVMYHGCGDIHAILEDFIEIGVDVLNPLEAKANMDVLELRRRYGHRLGLCGNSNMQVWESGDRNAIRREVLRKLNAARGGGYIFASDHSVAGDVSGRTYDEIVGLVRKYGKYPLELGEYTEQV
ncbi:MAG: uroporphyrinogen decarboxylase family protein, partial [Kiritimatiellae bacterium]|nr:uroporphyrinogen decarboxylase family protein [Kiritimatiellia bacterium]